jgi:hypothetical protein
MPLSLPLFTHLDKYVVRDDVPGIVNANKEEQQRRSANPEQRWALTGFGHVCRSSPDCVRRKWKQNVKQQVLKYGLVGGLYSQTPSNDDGVHYPAEAQQTPNNRDSDDLVPWTPYSFFLAAQRPVICSRFSGYRAPSTVISEEAVSISRRS